MKCLIPFNLPPFPNFSLPYLPSFLASPARAKSSNDPLLFVPLKFLLARFNAITTGKSYLNQIAFQLSLITESLQSLINDLHIATTQYRTLGIEILYLLRPNDLILRDMGYLPLSVFAEIEQKQAYWLGRLSRCVHGTNEAGTSIEKVRQKAKTDTIDISCHLGGKPPPARLIAVRCSDQERRKNRRQLSENYKMKRKTPTRDQLTRCDWHITVTN